MFAPGLQRQLYRRIAKPIFFRSDPERVHDAICRLSRSIGANAAGRRLFRMLYAYQHPSLETEVCGIRFPNPVGLSAGFDKNAELIDILPSVGFGFEEIGSVTGEACEGNPKPRLWRLPESQALVVHYGLKNDGCEAIADRMKDKKDGIPIGTSIAKTNSADTVPLENGIADYVKAFRAFADIGDYFTVNISCPNAYGGEPFADPDRLEALLAALDRIPTKKPVFLKLSADTSRDAMDAILNVTDRHRVHGFVLANLTKDRTNPLLRQHELKKAGNGGISGKPVAAASNALISHVYQKAGGRCTIIGVGGIFSAEDAYEKIRHGASLVQLITGMIYEGPQLIGEINRGLVRLMERDGIRNIRDAVGNMTRS